MTEFPSNSIGPSKPAPATVKKNPPTKKVERVTTGEVVQRKQSLGKRFKNTFFGGDARGAVSYVALEVLIPATRDAIVEGVTQVVERVVFGEVRSRGRGGWRPANSGYTSYSGTFRGAATPPWNRGQAQEPRREISSRGRATHDFGEIALESRGEAEEVIDQLMEIVATYQQASLSDLYAMVAITPQYTDQKYGWTDLRGAGVVRDRSGLYLLNLPKPVLLD